MIPNGWFRTDTRWMILDGFLMDDSGWIPGWIPDLWFRMDDSRWIPDLWFRMDDSRWIPQMDSQNGFWMEFFFVCCLCMPIFMILFHPQRIPRWRLDRRPSWRSAAHGRNHQSGCNALYSPAAQSGDFNSLPPIVVPSLPPSSMQENPLPDEVAQATPQPQWLLTPSGSKPDPESIRSASPAGSDNVFVAEPPEAPDHLVFRPPEGFADSPSSLFPPPPVLPLPPGDDISEGGAKRKRDSGRSKRAKSSTLPDAVATVDAHLGGSTKSLETGTGDASVGRELDVDWTPSGGRSGPNRAVSTNEMWYPETHLPPKRQLTVRAKSEERERWNKPTRR